MFIKKFHISYKSSNYYAHDYSNFGEEKFIHDFSKMTGLLQMICLEQLTIISTTFTQKLHPVWSLMYQRKE